MLKGIEDSTSGPGGSSGYLNSYLHYDRVATKQYYDYYYSLESPDANLPKPTY